MLRLLVVTIALVLAASASPARAAQPRLSPVGVRLDTAVRAYTPGDVFMGAVLVAKDRAILLNKGYGLADTDRRTPNEPTTQYRVGSLTKQFTAAAVLLLQEDGKLAINDPVGKFVPTAPPEWRSVTLTQLLSHTSGIPDFTRDPGFMAQSHGLRPWPSEFGRLRSTALLFSPGSRFDYSSTNYELLGLVIESASGMPYGAFLQKRIFTPLAMNSTGVAAEGLHPRHLAVGESLQRNGALTHAKAPQLATAWAAGAVYSTTGDLLRWERGLFGPVLLSKASLATMTTPGAGGYGLGVSVGAVDGLPLVFHGGAIEGFHSFLLYVPSRRITVAVLGNVEAPAADKLAAQLLAIALDHDDVLPPISAGELDRFVGTYDLKGFALAFRRDGATLNSISGDDVIPLLYEGIVAGQPTFFVPRLGAEITFAPNAKGEMTLVLHQNGQELRGARR